MCAEWDGARRSYEVKEAKHHVRTGWGRLPEMGVVLGLLTALTATAWAAPFREVPPTIGAYTLRGGEWQVGAGLGLPLAALNYWVASVSLAYGISNWFQAGIAMSYGVQPSPPSAYMTYSGYAKLRLPLGAGIDLGIPFGFSFVDRGAGTEFGSVQSGAVASMRMGAGLTLHGGANLGATKGGGWYARPYAIADFDILPNLKLVGELGIIPLSVTISAWIRLLDFLDVELTLAPLALAVTGSVYLRF